MIDKQPAIAFRNVFEAYEVEIKTDHQIIRESFEALKGVSFTVQPGESVAVMGPNGAGKSTMLRLIAGLLRPEKGDVNIHGRVSSLLDLGAGFHPELTGRDNLLLNASLYNFSRADMNARLESILAFADIGKFIDVPVRCYSQGMYVRLAFSLAIHVDPDILIIDDCLAVGDDNFRLKSIDKVLEFRTRGKTVILVTHDFAAARQVCDRGLYIREGRLLRDGPVEEVIASYVTPVKVDADRYRFLAAKLDDDERRQVEQDRLKQQELRERRLAPVELSVAGGLRLIAAPGKVQLFMDSCQLTDEDGIRVLFDYGDNLDVTSATAKWRVLQTSRDSVICLLRWAGNIQVSQIWRWARTASGDIDLRIEMRTRDGRLTGNRRVECRLTGLGDTPGGKNKSVRLGADNNVLFITGSSDQVTGRYLYSKGRETIYFLSLWDEPKPETSGPERRWKPFFSGTFHVADQEKIAAANIVDEKPHVLTGGDVQLFFAGGRADLGRSGKRLTSGMGLYTSLYVRGVWHDSAQARWSVLNGDDARLLVKGCWPWVPVVQFWDIQMEGSDRIQINLRMKVLRDTPIRVYETALMLNSDYRQWSSGGHVNAFPSDVTKDDFFRICLSSRDADGKNYLACHGEGMPETVFAPALLPGQRIVLENAGHVGATEARLLHCMKVFGHQEPFMPAGEYQLFNGHIYIKGGS
ncbi:MAG: ABC transporter ATP-binding protein [Candidatus Omnitrophica bacterium]|nr:ABC transporter ATP-binding protein [Candidatus Omnitrophota bacterium]